MAAARTRSLFQPQWNIEIVNGGQADVAPNPLLPLASLSLSRLSMNDAADQHRLKLDRM